MPFELTSVFEIPESIIDNNLLIETIQNSINEILGETDKPLKSIRIFSSLRFKDCNALAIKIVAYTKD